MKHKLFQKISTKIYETKNIFKDNNNSNKPMLEVTELFSFLQTLERDIYQCKIKNQRLK